MKGNHLTHILKKTDGIRILYEIEIQSNFGLGPLEENLKVQNSRNPSNL